MSPDKIPLDEREGLYPSSNLQDDDYLPKRTPSVPPTPVLDKRNLVLADSNKIGEFLDWLTEQGIVLGRWIRPEGWIDEILSPIPEGADALLHRYFDIDPVAEEAEKRALLEYLRTQH